jgi:AraC-like DNA-binding protein
MPVDTPQRKNCILLIRFPPNFVYGIGSPSNDYLFVLPFYAGVDIAPFVIREKRVLSEMHRIIVRLVRCFAEQTSYFELGCKAFLLELLYHVTLHFRIAGASRAELFAQKGRLARLEPALTFVQRNYARPITLKAAASVNKMSIPYFVKLFRRTTGHSFLSYATHVRLLQSVRLLTETSLTITTIAHEVGFSDQSYFDRRFKRAFGKTPRDFRRETRSLPRGVCR